MNWAIVGASLSLLASGLWAVNTLILMRRNRQTSEDIAVIRKILHRMSETGTMRINDGPPMLVSQREAKQILTKLFETL